MIAFEFFLKQAKGNRENLLLSPNSCIIDFVRFAEFVAFTEFPLHLGKSFVLHDLFLTRFASTRCPHVPQVPGQV